MTDYSESNRQAWNERAKSYDTEEWAQKLANQLVDEIRSRIDFIGAEWASSADNEKHVKLLDYACGTGMVTRALREHVTATLGVDISENMVEEYNSRMRADGLKASALAGNLVGPGEPTPPATDAEYMNFDLVAVGLGFHHFGDPKLTIERLAERLRPETGVLLILDWLPSSKDPKYVGQANGHHHHHHHHHHDDGHGGSVEQDSSSAHDDFAEMRHTIGHDGFDEELMRRLYESAGLVDFRFVTFDEPVTMHSGDKAVKRTPFLARGRRK